MAIDEAHQLRTEGAQQPRTEGAQRLRTEGAQRLRPLPQVKNKVLNTKWKKHAKNKYQLTSMQTGGFI